MTAMNLNCNTYVLTPSGTSQAITLSPQDANQSSLIIYNASSKDVAIKSNGGSSATAIVFPASATVGVPCTVVGPGAIVTFTKNSVDQFLSAIQDVAGTGNLYVKVGPGQ